MKRTLKLGRVRLVIAGAVLGILLVAATGCGGGDDAEATPATAVPAVSTQPSGSGRAAEQSTAFPSQTPLPGGDVTPVAPNRPGTARTQIAGATPGANLRAAMVPVEVIAGAGATASTLKSVTFTAQAGREAIVFEFTGAVPGYKVDFVDSASACGSGQPVSVVGAAKILVRFFPANAHDAAGKATTSPTVAGTGAFTEAKQTCDFEAVTSWLVGLSAKSPANVLVMGNRLIITPRAR